MEAQFKDRGELITALTRLLSKQQQDAAPILAGAAMLAPDVAMERWQERRGKDELGGLIQQVFATLENQGPVR